MDDYTYGYEEILDDERNARDPRKDHRTGGRPVPGMAVTPFGRRRPVHQGASSGSRQVVIYREPPVMQEQRSGLLGNLTTDEIVELAAQVFASFQPIPAGPTATGDMKTDIENLITYQSALALHAKRDEQLRMIGSLLSKLISK
jgi:hypothetical protein